MSIIRADSIKNRAGNGAPDFPNGITVTGVVTATSMSQSISGNLTVTGNVGVGGTLTYEDVTNVDSIGIITARSEIQVGSAVTANSGGVDTVGVVTATSFKDKAGGTFAPNPTTTRGDLIVRGVSVNERLAIGAAGKVLKVNSSANGLEYGDGGKVLQIVRARGTGIYSTSNDNGNYRQNLGTGNGTSCVSVTITPTAGVNSHFYIWCQSRMGITGNSMASATLMHGNTKLAGASANGYAGDAGNASIFAYVDTGGLSGSQTFDFRNHGTRGGHACYMNANNSAQDAALAGTGPGGANNTGVHITVMEMLD